MKLRKQLVLRVVAGVLLFALALGVTYTIKGVLSAREPVNALPEIDIIYNSAPLPQEHIQLASYSWRFFPQVKKGELVAPGGWDEIVPAPVNPGTPLQISFSYACKELKISRALRYSNLFTEISQNNTLPGEENAAPATVGNLNTPTEPGEYVYRVEAWWGVHGSVQYYFTVRVD